MESAMTEDPHAAVIATDAPAGTEPLTWGEVRQRLEAEKWYWLADKIYSTTSPDAAKGRNLKRLYGAPTAGGPPYRVYEIAPTVGQPASIPAGSTPGPSA
jgi:hypothetical protein